MKISREINGQFMEFELTDSEMSDAYSDVQFQACRDIVEKALKHALQPNERITEDICARDKIINELARQLCNDERESIEYFLSEDLARKLSEARTRGLVVPLRTKDLSARMKSAAQQSKILYKSSVDHKQHMEER